MLTENSFERLSDPVVGIAEEYILSLLKRLQQIARRLVNDPSANVDIRDEITKLQALQASFLGDAEDWTTEAIPKAYIRGIEDVNGTVRELDVDVTPQQMSFTGGIFATASGGFGGSIPNKVRELFSEYPNHLTMYEVFIAAVNDDFRRTNIPVLRDMEDKIRELVISASDIDYQEANVFTRRQLSQDIMDQFARENITGIRYSDGRTMKLDTYSEMVARTQTGNAARQAQLNRLNELGHDLVRMSVHWPCSPMCIDWQGGVYDQNGNSNQFPALSTAINGGAFHVNSYIKDMETYTKQGWKLIKNLDGSEQVMSLNPETLIPEWCGISELHEHESEKMIELKSNSFDLCVTPDHDLFIGYRGRKGDKRVMKYKFCKAEEAIERSFFTQLRCVNWEGETQDMPISGINESDFARLLAWFISDGHVDGNSIRIAKSKEPHVSEMKPTLENIGFYHDGVKFTIYNKEWAEYFKQFGKSYEKFLPEWILNNRPDIINFFLEAYVWGDGSKRTNEYKEHEFESITYFTTSDKLAGQIGEAIIKAGKYPSYSLQKNKGKAVEHHNGTYEGNHDVWRISANTIQESYYNNIPSTEHRGIQAEVIDYNDTAYCITLEKNHVMWVRRNGKTTWSGNCKHSLSGYFPGTSKKIEDRDKFDKRENERRYNIEQTQRYNERNIRYWKRREATALTDDARNKAKAKISQWQKRNRELISENDFLRRKYYRESI